MLLTLFTIIYQYIIYIQDLIIYIISTFSVTQDFYNPILDLYW